MQCGVSLGKSQFWLCTNTLLSTADLGTVLDLGQGESQWLDRVGDSGIRGQVVSEKITLPSISVSFPHSVPHLVLLLFCFIFFISTH